LKVAVVGAGVMGTNHARVLSSISDVELVAVVDADTERAAGAARAYGGRAVGNLDDLGDIDAAVVAVPTPAHLSVATRLIDRGVHVLVEKPLAPSVVEAREICAAARQAGVVLMVGFVERFNPVALELANIISHPLHFETTRISPYSTRIGDGVVLDLMIHDLDLVASFIAQPLVSASAILRHDRSVTEDLAVALLEFAGGVTASLTASRIGQQKIRDIRITQSDSVIVADLLKQQIEIHRVDHVEYSSDDGRRYRQTGMVEIPFLEHRGEPLALEIREFLDAVRNQREPRVTGEDGVRALEMADEIVRVGRPTCTTTA
jgi:predicted dehydrogenase